MRRFNKKFIIAVVIVFIGLVGVSGVFAQVKIRPPVILEKEQEQTFKKSLGCADWDKIVPNINDDGYFASTTTDALPTSADQLKIDDLFWKCSYGTNKAIGTLIKEDKATFSKNTINLKAIKFLQYALGFLAIIGFAMILYGGFTWATSGGNEPTIDRARRILLAAIIGLVIITSAWVIVSFVTKTSINVLT